MQQNLEIMTSNKTAEAIGAIEEISPDAAKNDPMAPAPHEISSQDNPVEEKKVLSVELAGAIAKDQPKYRSKRQFQLFCFCAFVTLSAFLLSSHHTCLIRC